MANKRKDDTKGVVVECIPMDLGSVCSYKYDEKTFSDGVDVGSYLAGIGTAIKHVACRH